MNISVEITGNLLEYLNSKVKKGTYKSRSEVIRTAIREMIKRDLEMQLQAKGITPENLSKLRDEVAREIIEKKYSDLA
ncbi:MAG: ribbon-helix-helix protein, CopG family [Thermoplasmata archaeon]|nr:ribbon-helix-helix protein, CopG family [Thermoplasmata archaeon]